MCPYLHLYYFFCFDCSAKAPQDIRMAKIKRNAALKGIGTYDENSASNDETDPFANDDNSSDLDYEQPKKQPRIVIRKQIIRAKPVNVPKKKILSKAERIARLKAKFNRNTPSCSSNVNTLENNINLLNDEKEDNLVFENHDHLFHSEQSDNGSGTRCGSPISIQSGQSTSEFVTRSISDHVAKSNAVQFESANESNPTAVRTESLNSCDDSDSMVPSLTCLISQLQSQIRDLSKEITLMRKQIARIEIKSMPTEPIGSIKEADLLNLDESLATLGLPVNVCIGVNDLETKLRGDSEYRKQLVIICSFAVFFQGNHRLY